MIFLPMLIVLDNPSQFLFFCIIVSSVRLASEIYCSHWARLKVLSSIWTDMLLSITLTRDKYTSEVGMCLAPAITGQ